MLKARAKISLRWFSSFVLYCFLTQQSAVAATGDENWDAQFGVPGANGPISAITVVGNSIYFGGSFSSIGGISATNVARWDGTNWSPLGLGVDGPVAAIVASGTDLFAGGIFNQAGGTPATNIAQWNGTNWFALGTGINGNVSALAVIGKDLFAGGSFNSAGGVAVSNIARWDGTNWSDVAGGINGPVTKLLANGNTLYAGGSFTQAGFSTATNIAKWEGTNWLSLGSGLPVAPSAIAGSDLSVYAYSMSSSYQDETRFMILKWDGTNWITAVAGEFVPPCFDCYARAGGMAINGKDIYIGGLFSRIQNPSDFEGTSANSIAKWDGSKWAALGSGLGAFFSMGAVTLVGTGSELFVGGGFFITAGGNSSKNIALWHIPHALSVSWSGDLLTLSWPATGTNFVLEATDTLPPTNWVEIYDAPVLAGDQLIVTNSISSTTRYYRLRRR